MKKHLKPSPVQPGWAWDRIKRQLPEAILFVEKIAIGVEVFNKPKVSEALVRQNHRIWMRL